MQLFLPPFPHLNTALVGMKRKKCPSSTISHFFSPQQTHSASAHYDRGPQPAPLLTALHCRAVLDLLAGSAVAWPAPDRVRRRRRDRARARRRRVHPRCLLALIPDAGVAVEEAHAHLLDLGGEAASSRRLRLLPRRPCHRLSAQAAPLLRVQAPPLLPARRCCDLEPKPRHLED